MNGLERDTIGGFNSMIEKQKKAEGEALIFTKVKQMIERQKAKYGWEFLFLGVNIDAVATEADSESAQIGRSTTSATVKELR